MLTCESCSTLSELHNPNCCICLPHGVFSNVGGWCMSAAAAYKFLRTQMRPCNLLEQLASNMACTTGIRTSTILDGRHWPPQLLTPAPLHCRALLQGLCCSREQSAGCPSCRPGQLPFLLMSEMLKGTGSFWHAYIQHLPSHHNLLVRWSTCELAALQDAALVSEVMERPQSLRPCPAGSMLGACPAALLGGFRGVSLNQAAALPAFISSGMLACMQCLEAGATLHLLTCVLSAVLLPGIQPLTSSGMMLACCK